MDCEANGSGGPAAHNIYLLKGNYELPSGTHNKRHSFYFLLGCCVLWKLKGRGHYKILSFPRPFFQFIRKKKELVLLHKKILSTQK